ncbi:DEAD/DEAH box helicase [Thiomicrorhabdus heinhorstiae]|uniref:DEAD/DEAH box helicase n=1 Tax=Thiomicrorhabdus heinhorstiae TaxID=2748010 RepID=A0ABS0BXH6_9GAMM|nr:DEAD/DEAH box helicase [Thiomicrorhabdus heinhorstiae]MBF6058474.1 DEAD/DEAH box helicase [Thiomicrorhabdus heinhorstiae]
MSFAKLGLSDPILKALSDSGYQTPTEIQKKAIPLILKGEDIIASAQTGTGKTASFVLPILQKLNNGETVRGRSIRALILVPTRELAIQVEKSILNYGKHLKLSSLAIYGGTDIEENKQRLADGIDILVATPGRLLDMAYQRALFFNDLEFLVLDEADRMLDMGFIDDLNKIIDRLPANRQSMLFSATLNDKVRYLADTVYDDAVEIRIAPKDKTAKIEQWMIAVDKDTKSALLSHLIKENQWDQALIFVEKKHSAAKLVEQLGKRGIIADSIHAGRSQAQREKVWDEFKTGKLQFLVATGVAARGLDMQNLSRVINYDLPYPAEEYVHRIGRTGRAGNSGEAISLVSKDDFKNLCMIESLLNQLLERREVAEFPVRKPVPISILNYHRK